MSESAQIIICFNLINAAVVQQTNKCRLAITYKYNIQIGTLLVFGTHNKPDSINITTLQLQQNVNYMDIRIGKNSEA